MEQNYKRLDSISVRYEGRIEFKNESIVTSIKLIKLLWVETTLSTKKKSSQGAFSVNSNSKWLSWAQSGQNPSVKIEPLEGLARLQDAKGARGFPGSPARETEGDFEKRTSLM